MAPATPCYLEARSRPCEVAVVLPGDAPLVRTETLKALIAAHHSGNAAATILSAVLADPSGYGRVVRKSRRPSLPSLKNRSSPTSSARSTRSSAIYCFTLEKTLACPGASQTQYKHRELYLTDAIAVLSAKGETVLAQVAADSGESPRLQYSRRLAEVDRIFRERKRDALMDDGVTIQLPETVLIDPDVTAGETPSSNHGVQLNGDAIVH